jgi:hypothetical protein
MNVYPEWFHRQAKVWRSYAIAERLARGTNRMTGEPLTDALRDRRLQHALRDCKVPRRAAVWGFAGHHLIRR